jgi:hypothetical protein
MGACAIIVPNALRAARREPAAAPRCRRDVSYKNNTGGYMKFFRVLCLIGTLLLATGVAIADEVPDDRYVENTMEALGFAPAADIPPGSASEMVLTVEREVRIKRLSISGAMFLKIDSQWDGVGADASTVPEYIELVAVRSGDHVSYWERTVPPAEVERLKLEKGTDMSAEDFAKGLREGAKGAIAVGLLTEAQISGLPVGGPGGLSNQASILFAQMDLKQDTEYTDAMNGRCVEALAQDADKEGKAFSAPWVNPSPAGMMFGNACFMLFAADAIDEARKPTSEENKAAAEAYLAALDAAYEALDFHGKEDVRGHQSYKIGADDLGMVQEVDGEKAEIDKMTVWIDAQTFVRRKMRLEGVMEQGGRTQDICMEQVYDDYRNVPDSALYEPYERILRICTPLTPEQQQELKEAEAQLADYETQLAQLKPAQRDMMKRMIEPQIERMKTLARGGTAEFRRVTTAIEINPDIGSPAAAPVVDDDEQSRVVRIVQQHLSRLGYEPGNTNGVLDKPTVVAIVRFQSDNELEVTGEATPQLAGILAAHVDAQ